MATTGTVETEFEFLKDLPQRDSDWPDGLVNEIKSYTAAFKEHKGLIPQSAVPDLLQVSKQRFFQLRKKYEFWNAKYFGKQWYSRVQLQAFHKVNRKDGQPGHDVGKILKCILRDAADQSENN